MGKFSQFATASLLLFIFATNAFADDEARQPAVATAIFAGGCFWCMEPPFDKLDGVISTTSGYSGGQTVNPSYKQVSSGTTGHAEVVQVEYNPQQISYDKLLEVFWHNVDPTRNDGQFCDNGKQYRPAIYYLNEQQHQAALASRKMISKTKKFPASLKVEITQAARFYAAEDYHQDYYQKNPVRYKYYRYACGRDSRLQELWGS